MRDDLARHAFHQVGACEGPSISMHVVRGCDQFLLCGEMGVHSEQSPFSATHDLLKLWRSSQGPDSDAVVTRQVTEPRIPATISGMSAKNGYLTCSKIVYVSEGYGTQ